MKKVDKFCYKHPGFGISNLMVFIIVGTLAVYLVSIMDRSGAFLNALTFSAYDIFRRGQVWRLVTFMLIPQNFSPFFILFSLMFYYWIGSTLERHWGTGRFTVFYFTGVLMNILAGTLVWLITGVSFGITAGYLNFSLFLAFATLFPDMSVRLFFIIPIRIKWLALIEGFLFIIAIFTDSFPFNLMPVIAILNYLLFCAGDLWAYIQPHKAARGSGTVNFRREARKIKNKEKNKPYNRKCSVCGRTDTENPDLSFRYCSQCQGFHCFCEDHINSHVHFRD